MNDQLLIATACDDTVRIYAALTTQIVEDARKIHDTWPTATAALGRTLTATLMMGVLNDNLYRLTIRVACDGPLGGILAVSNQRGIVKGYVTNPHIDPDLNNRGKLDVAQAVGLGQLLVTKDIGLKEPYQGVVPLQSGEIAEDFAYYFTKSEQTPSAVSLGVLVSPEGDVKVAGGLIIQLMPGAQGETITFLEKKLNNIPSITTLFERGITPKELICEVMGDMVQIKVLEELNEIGYACDCSKDKFQGPLLSLGAAELHQLFKDDAPIEVKCHFCNRVYHYRYEELHPKEGQDA